MIDLPAPVSPVSTVQPGNNSSSSCSVVTKLRSLSMTMFETIPPRLVPLVCHGVGHVCHSCGGTVGTQREIEPCFLENYGGNP